MCLFYMCVCEELRLMKMCTGRWKWVSEPACGVPRCVQGDGSGDHDQHLLPCSYVLYAAGT